MRRCIASIPALLLIGVLANACNGTTGDEIVTFSAYAAGAAKAGDPFTINECQPPEVCPFTIQLTYAHMYVGAIYVDEAPASSGGTFNTPACISQGTYCAQVPGGLDVDLLSTEPQMFQTQGSGSADLGLSWELYLTPGDINNPDNSGFGVPDTADLIGTAKRESDGKVFSWAATVTINALNRGKPAQPGQPGEFPICQERILDLANISLTLAPGNSMLLTIDPRGWFLNPIDFSTLPSVASPQCERNQNSMYGTAEYCIPDSSNLPGDELGSRQGYTLFENGILQAGSAAYTLTYMSL